MCQTLHVLPRGGGLLDQDAFLVAAMDMVVDAQNSKRELDTAQQQQDSDRDQHRLGKRPQML